VRKPSHRNHVNTGLVSKTRADRQKQRKAAMTVGHIAVQQRATCRYCYTQLLLSPLYRHSDNVCTRAWGPTHTKVLSLHRLSISYSNCAWLPRNFLPTSSQRRRNKSSPHSELTQSPSRADFDKVLILVRFIPDWLCISHYAFSTAIAYAWYRPLALGCLQHLCSWGHGSFSRQLEVLLFLLD
jgi:hypothetical protein